MTRIIDLTEEDTPVGGDFLLLAKAADGSWRKLDIANLPGGGSAFSFCQVRNTDTSTNINANVDVPFGGTTDATDADYTLATSSITVNFDGVVHVDAHVSQSGSSDRTNVGFYIALNGTQISGVGRSGYIRNASGHNSSSSHMSATFAVSDGDVITLKAGARANSGTVVQSSGASQVTVERRS